MTAITSMLFPAGSNDSDDAHEAMAENTESQEGPKIPSMRLTFVTAETQETFEKLFRRLVGNGKTLSGWLYLVLSPSVEANKVLVPKARDFFRSNITCNWSDSSMVSEISSSMTLHY